MAKENKEHDIEILPPFSLDLYWDSGDPMLPNGIFQVLKNYVPEGDVLRTRKGVTLFTFS